MRAGKPVNAGNCGAHIYSMKMGIERQVPQVPEEKANSEDILE